MNPLNEFLGTRELIQSGVIVPGDYIGIAMVNQSTPPQDWFKTMADLHKHCPGTVHVIPYGAEETDNFIMTTISRTQAKVNIWAPIDKVRFFVLFHMPTTNLIGWYTFPYSLMLDKGDSFTIDGGSAGIGEFLFSMRPDVLQNTIANNRRITLERHVKEAVGPSPITRILSWIRRIW